MSKGAVRIAMKDEYYCYGCRLFHKFKDRPPDSRNKRRNYCTQSWEKTAQHLKEQRK